MFNLRIATASTVTFVVLLLIWSKIAERGYDKVMPKIEEKQKRIAEIHQQFSNDIKQDMAGLGGCVEDASSAPLHPSEGDFAPMTMPARQLRPLGTWMGVRGGEENNLVFMKFEKKKYWLWIKNPHGDDLKEKGEYEYLYDSIEFKPEGKSSYMLEYYMISKDGISLSSYNNYYKMEREKDIEFDF